MTIHALQRNMQVENVVIDYRDRPEGSESKLNTYSDGFKVLGTIARLFKNYRPFSFFGILAAILAVFGIGFMIPVLGEYFRTGLVPRFPTLIVCCFVLVAALLDRALGAENAMFRDAVIWYYVANESLSILENLALAGVPFPARLRAALEQLRQKQDEAGKNE